MNDQEKKTHISQLKQKQEEIKGDINNTITECEDIEGEFNSIKDHVKEMVTLFHKAKFYSNIANKQTYDEDTQFNEQNITGYLSELEEYISSLITLLAHQRDDKNAAISSIPLDVLDPKDFNKKETYIDAPIDTEKKNISGAKTDVGDESGQNMDDDAIIDGKALYKNFNDLMKAEKVDIIT